MKMTEKYSIGLWLVVALMLTTITLRYVDDAERPLILASEENSFIVNECPGKNVVYGWGNRGVGTESNEVGCFNAKGNKIENVFSLEECRQLACR